MENKAWLLKDGNGDYFAVSDIEMVEYQQQVTFFAVPISPYYCNHVVAWREQLIPLVNLALILRDSKQEEINQIGVFAYQTDKNSVLNYLAIPISESPLHIIVNDDQFCELPDHYTNDTSALATSCFDYQDEAVPIINLNYLCSSEFRHKLQCSV